MIRDKMAGGKIKALNHNIIVDLGIIHSHSRHHPNT